MKPNSLKHDRLQVLQYFLSLRGVHIPQSRSFPARCVALDPITDTRLLFLHFFGAGLPLAAGGRHCRTGRRMGPQDGPQDDKEWMRQLQPPPPRRHRDEGRLMLFINFRRCETLQTFPYFSPWGLIPHISKWISGQRISVLEGHSFITRKANKAFGKHVYIYASK